jgi:hypothetical protein
MKTVLAHPFRLKPCLAPTRLLHIAILWDVASTFLGGREGLHRPFRATALRL